MLPQRTVRWLDAGRVECPFPKNLPLLDVWPEYTVTQSIHYSDRSPLTYDEIILFWKELSFLRWPCPSIYRECSVAEWFDAFKEMLSYAMTFKPFVCLGAMLDWCVRQQLHHCNPNANWQNIFWTNCVQSL